ncbi:PmoA family protein [Isoptericola sp. 4D.3]|uniref:PmoA family protein n=1 Tax=Isoptericola peretonis TaxID=2918523 RepID=A0ABT0J3F1_9MICO|nr:PmoA family protein [Isoptericola sp. 4D.3]
MTAPGVALVGGHGFASRHLEHLRSAERSGRARLLGVADPRPPEGDAGGVPWFDSLDELLDAGVGPDVVVVSTPPHTHAPLALRAMAAGADVYLEKPPVTSWAQFAELEHATRDTGRVVQVGFQSLGSDALAVVDRCIRSGEIGEVLAVGAVGAWSRTVRYFGRSAWAGRRVLDGVDVVDGVATNPLAHAVVTALRLAGARRAEDVLHVDADLYHAHAIDSDDTSVVRARTTSGVAVTLALTLCAPEQSAPTIRVRGTRGTIELSYTTDELTIDGVEGRRTLTTGRAHLLDDLLAHRRTGAALLSPLADSGAFVRVLEAVRVADAPRQIPPEAVTWTGTGDDRRPVVHDVEAILERAVTAQATLAELGVPWARTRPPLDVLDVDGVPVAELRDGSDVATRLSPRPYLHPVSTLGGVIVTDHLATDHAWHLGVGLAIQDVEGTNHWGGRTFTAEDRAYVWRDDHGRVRLDDHAREGGVADEVLTWCDPSGGPLLTERRRWEASSAPHGWWLDLRTELRSATGSPVSLGGPGSNGRSGGGYGGFFWRVAPCTGVHVRTAHDVGEQAVHGTTSSWLAWTAEFGAGTATLVFVAPHHDDTDPWFVRSAGYPGVGLALAWDRHAVAPVDEPLRRHVRVLVADGVLDDDRVGRLVADALAGDLAPAPLAARPA